MKPKEILFELVAKAEKMLLVRPEVGLTVDILLTEKYLVIYAHSKGSHWNIGGRHYKYFHDLTTGEFIPDGLLPSGSRSATILSKERFLVADYKRCQQIFLSRVKTVS
jgi:hypothetical protein